MENIIKIEPINVQEAEQSRMESETTLVEAKKMEIVDTNGYEWAGGYLRTIKQKMSDLDKLRKSITRPLDESKKRIMELFKTPITVFEEAGEIIEKSLITYRNKQEQIRLEQERKLQVEANRKREEAERKAEEFRAKGKEAKAEQWEEKAQTIVAPTLAPNVPKLNGVSYRDVWSAEIEDFDALPAEYKMANMPMLDKIIAATKGAIKIPGVIAKSEKITVTRK